MASIKHLVDIDLNKNQLTNVKLQHISGNPSGTGEDFEGRIFYDSAANAVKFHNGTDFIALGTSNASGDLTAVVAGTGMTGTDLSGPIPTLNVIGGTGITANANDIAIDSTVVTKTGTQTLTNKTIAASQVTEISNITASEGAQLENIGSTTISAAQWGYLGAATGAITNSDTVDMGDGFVLEDADGTEVTITENKEVKFTGTGGLTINWTDVSTGSDGDPFDLQFAIGTLNQNTTGSAATLTTARNIGGVSFNGSADINLPGVNTGGDQDTSGNAATATKIASITNSNIVQLTASQTLTNKTIAASQVTEISNITAAEGAQLENIGSTTISAAQWGYLGAATGAITNTDVSVSAANLKTALGDGFPSDAVTIGDSDDTVTFANDVAINGDLTVTGDTITTNTTQLTVKDPLIVIANNNAADVLDTGFYSTYVAAVEGTSAQRYAGIVRDASEDTDSFIFFKDLTDEPGTTVNTAHASFTYADLKAATGKFTAITGNLTGNVTGNTSGSSGSCTGNAATATKISSITNSNIVQLASTQTLTNKTIAISQVTELSNLTATEGAQLENIGSTTISAAQWGYLGAATGAITNTDTVDMGSGFVIEDGDGTEVTITENKEIKFVEGGNIDINFTDTSTGSDGDPFDLTFSVPDAATGTKGAVELATTAEALAGSDSDRAVTPAGLAARSFKDTLGDGSATAITVNHALGTRDVMVQLYDASSYETLVAQVVRTDTANVTVTFNVAPASNDVICLVTKID